MKFSDAIDRFVLDMWSQGRFTSEATERSYRSVLDDGDVLDFDRVELVDALRSALASVEAA